MREFERQPNRVNTSRKAHAHLTFDGTTFEVTVKSEARDEAVQTISTKTYKVGTRPADDYLGTGVGSIYEDLKLCMERVFVRIDDEAQPPPQT